MSFWASEGSRRTSERPCVSNDQSTIGNHEDSRNEAVTIAKKYPDVILSQSRELWKIPTVVPPSQ